MRTTKGFTLIEMVIVMIIVGIVLAVASTLLRAGFTSYFTAVKTTTLTTQATNAMARITKELQQAKSFTAMNAANTTFTTSGGTTISYSWVSPILTRTGTGAQTLSNQVTGFTLTYYQSNFTAATSLLNIDAVTISMTLSNSNESVALINTVFLNNTI
jgi:prepilin-type N-terminal cleavage/methylation domain-containing protein